MSTLKDNITKLLNTSFNCSTAEYRLALIYLLVSKGELVRHLEAEHSRMGAVDYSKYFTEHSRKYAEGIEKTPIDASDLAMTVLNVAQALPRYKNFSFANLLILHRTGNDELITDFSSSFRGIVHDVLEFHGYKVIHTIKEDDETFYLKRADKKSVDIVCYSKEEHAILAALCGRHADAAIALYESNINLNL